MNEPIDLSDILATLRRELPRWTRDYGLVRLRVFGSVARREAKEGSDLDLFADFAQLPDIFTFVELKMEIEDLLGVRVDLVMEDALKPAVRAYALEHVVPV